MVAVGFTRSSLSTCVTALNDRRRSAGPRIKLYFFTGQAGIGVQFGNGFLAGRLLRRLPRRAGGCAAFGAAGQGHRPLHWRIRQHAGQDGLRPLAAAKAGLRMISQSMAREFGPQGIHVAHAVIDGGINGDRLRASQPTRVAEKGETGLLGIDAIAETYWQIHRQHPSAWTQEIDLRPSVEVF